MCFIPHPTVPRGRDQSVLFSGATVPLGEQAGKGWGVEPEPHCVWEELTYPWGRGEWQRVLLGQEASMPS